MTLTIIYLSGVIFFLIQAHKYAKVSWLLVRGALIWPVLLLILPQLIRHYKAMLEGEEAKLRYDQRLGCAACALVEGMVITCGE